MLARFRSILETAGGLLQGDADGAMFSQFDASPGLQTSVLSSDNLANNDRDGQNSQYLLDLDPAAISGNFTLLVSTPGNEVGVPVVITPVFYPNGGPVNPDATVQVIFNALQSLSIVGKDWPSVPVFPFGETPDDIQGATVQVRLVPASELTARAGTAWDPTTAGIFTNFYVYEITFLGELHDTQIGLKYVDGTSTLTAAPGDLALPGKFDLQQHEPRKRQHHVGD